MFLSSSFQHWFEKHFTHLNNSRFNFTSYMLREMSSNYVTKLETKNSQEHISSLVSKFLPALRETSSSINHSPFHSSSKFSNHSKEDPLCSLSLPTKSSPSLKTGSNHLPSVSSSNFIKGTLGSNKTLDSPSLKIVFKKNLGAYETFSSSCLGASCWIKSKVEAAKHLKSSF